MTITITPLQFADLVFYIAVIVSVIWLISTTRKLKKLTWELDQFKKGLIAHANKVSTPPSPKLIAQWTHLYETLPEDSPKYQAYKNRLIEVGVLDKDGKEVKEKSGN